MNSTPGVATILVMVALSSPGCGADAPSETGAAASSGAGASRKLTERDKGVKFAACVRAHGVGDFPDPDAKGEFAYGVSVTPQVFRKAVAACKDLEPAGALSSKRTPKQQAETLTFAKCIRAHGVKDFPDPVNGEPAIDTYKIPSSNTPRGMTVLNAAIDSCRHITGLGT